MTKELINAVLAEVCGCVIDEHNPLLQMEWGFRSTGLFTEDLNAAHMAEMRLLDPYNELMMRDWTSHLYDGMQGSEEIKIGTEHANAYQRAVALVKTVGTWEE